MACMLMGIDVLGLRAAQAPAPAASPDNKVASIALAVNGSAYTPYLGPLQYVEALAQSPSNWFAAAQAFIAADPPGKMGALCYSIECMYTHGQKGHACRQSFAHPTTQNRNLAAQPYMSTHVIKPI